MPLLDMQRRGQQIGRIRLGVQVLGNNGKMRPSKLETFRFTTGSRPAADAIADLYGGEVTTWSGGGFEVITRESAIGVMVPPRDQVVSQWYEMWNRGGCVRRCDSVTEQISGGSCVCPHAENADGERVPDPVERARQAAMMPPRACKQVTRINVMIPDLPGLGVFRLDTHSYYAAVEIADTAELLAHARDRGVFLPAVLRIDQRQRVAGGTTKHYPVVVLEALTTFRQLVSGELGQGGIAGQLPPVPAARAAIEAGPARALPAPEAAPVEAAEADPLDVTELTASSVLARAEAAHCRADVEALAAAAEAAGVIDDMACVDAAGDVWAPVRDALQDRWRAVPA